MKKFIYSNILIFIFGVVTGYLNPFVSFSFNWWLFAIFISGGAGFLVGLYGAEICKWLEFKQK